VKDSKRAQEVENMRSNVDMAKHLDTLKPEMVSTIVLDISLIVLNYHVL
jgi:hypothetical protein